MPSTPPTPLLFSTMTGWESPAARACAKARPKMSAGPPAGNPTTSLTGLVGYDWAETAEAARAAATKIRKCRTAVMRLPPEFFSGGRIQQAGRSVAQIGDPRGEPRAVRVPDQEHRARARNGRHRARIRAEHVVDPEVAVGRERNELRVEQSGARGIADQRGAHALVGVPADAVAPAEQQALAPHLDGPVGPCVGLQVGDHPDLPRRLDSADD